ncbi:Putative metallopeptidase (Zinc) SprT family [Fructilactobacillus florum 8D]|uniref:SprT-like protein n=2 Tax=Fructilactobacillus florum TaxID=640331 RepID=A0A0R2CMR9_9LACO|nr:SprT family protein [Fructilactobacillus florum]ETO40257.1 Putative metallopeptidase (Zinc) SprT family [Fructilactobacillus florum 8D]KRM92586.1 SprT-like protein [Fructilactobacillus florum DSM 22689 = JCM 16035]
MSNLELQQLVEKISYTFFNKPFQHRAYFNQRLQTTGGRYHLRSHDIDINPKMADSIPNLTGIIKHELVHYHLHLAGYSGKHNTPEFKHLLQQVGGSRYAPRLTKNYRYCYQCSDCGRQYNRQRRLNVTKYVCSRCRGRLVLLPAAKF